MADSQSNTAQRRRPKRWLWLLVAAILAFLLLFGPARQGCGPVSEETAREDAKQEKANGEGKADKEEQKYEFGELETVPSDDALPRNYVKPGHAVSAWIPAVSNLENLKADLETTVTNVSRRPVLIGETNYYLVMSRPVVLPRRQPKNLEATFFIPSETGSGLSNVFLEHTLRSARRNRIVHQASQITRPLADYQYLFPVIAENPDAYGYLKQLGSVHPPYDAIRDDQSELIYYRVILPPIEQRIPLPRHPFAWTMVSYLLWDGISPEPMTSEQQQALLDWLQWGGQLIVSGPGTLEQLEGTFMDEYLPASGRRTGPLEPPAIETLNTNWALLSEQAGGRSLELQIAPTAPLVGVRLKCRDGAAFVAGSGELVAERRVGRGRVVVTSFSLADPQVINWPSFDSFFNACLLRRPPRVFEESRLRGVRTAWEGTSQSRSSPLMLTGTRYFTRDAPGSPYEPPVDEAKQAEYWLDDGTTPDPVMGIGGWNDKSGPSQAAHNALREAAGVTIPDGSFVLGVLVVYVVVLVPVNWAVFRTLGRVEWAWAAAPLLSILGAIAVIRLAQLDIGFVRSRTEISVLEIQEGYPRAHLTRYLALYSSLSTRYELFFDEPSAMARPFPPTDSPPSLSPVTYRRDGDISLRGFQVLSSSTGFIHSEQFRDLDGTLSLEGEGPQAWEVRNGTSLQLEQVGLLYRNRQGRVMTCWLGDLPPGSRAQVNWFPNETNLPWISRWEQIAGLAPESRDDEGASLVELTELAARGMRLQPGDVRLVGWLDGLLSGLKIEPAASQVEGRSLVLAHLRRGLLNAPQPDKNLVLDVQGRGERREAAGKKDAEAFPDTGGQAPND